ncbi:ABC transporter permease [Vallicoccus soli]|uniref:Transport permease protein n=1 Tax=Vallicoccus soli TaxID=2339232 RepID=A0A3A3ZF68_9ACTN|nr:ABC transporter permease [Vallicoccus soli]RJK93767.1 ABC transporter permease [Vallicoccus soli]
MSLSFVPRPGAAPLPRRVLAQAGLELRLLLRNGEQLLITLVIPLAALLGLVLTTAVDLGPGERVEVALPGVLALAALSTAFTGQAIGTGFERRYGVLKRLAASPLPKAGLVAGKTLSVVAVEVLQVVLLVGAALALGWQARGEPLLAVLLLALGTAAFSGLALLMAGTLRAEATLAVANLAYLVLVAVGGVAVPLAQYPEAVQGLFALTPVGALTEGLRAALDAGGSGATGTPWGPLAVLTAWAVAAVAAAARAFRWE